MLINFSVFFERASQSTAHAKKMKRASKKTVPSVKKARRMKEPPYTFKLDEDPNTNARLSQWSVAAQLSSVFDIFPAPSGDAAIEQKVSGCERLTLVLDMDETLVHSRLDDTPSDLSLRLENEGDFFSVAVTFRPHLDAFLKFVSEHFEVVLFTAADKMYAEQVLDGIDPEGSFLPHRLFRDSCVVVEGAYVKDLRVLGRDIERTIILDDSPISFGFQVDNAIPITPWTGDMADETLPKITEFLRTLLEVKDVRPTLTSAFELRDILENKKL